MTMNGNGKIDKKDKNKKKSVQVEAGILYINFDTSECEFF